MIRHTFLTPQHLTSILACLLAVVLLATRHRWPPRVALTVAWIEIVAFLFFQWLGLALILALSAAMVTVARTRASDAARPLTA
jgi:hypothetical protein